MAGVDALARFVGRARRLVVLTGAGCSTASGIPDYRDETGAWKRSPPVTIQDFLASSAGRKRYWARSLVGWPRFAAARPNRAHGVLAELETQGRVEALITQNVDGLHQRAGSRRVTELHGSLASVRCLGCNAASTRERVQRSIADLNPGLSGREAPLAPDGDADLADADFAAFREPSCPLCGGILKPDVVFFGESADPQRVRDGMAAVENADAMLCVGTSLMLFSGFRFCRRAHEIGLPVAAINLGRTRADAMLALKIEAPCADTLDAMMQRLSC